VSAVCTRVDPGTFPVEAHLAHMRLRGLAETTIYERAGTLTRLVRFLSLDSAVELLAVTEDDLDSWQYGLVPRSARYRATSMSRRRGSSLCRGARLRNPAQSRPGPPVKTCDGSRFRCVVLRRCHSIHEGRWAQVQQGPQERPFVSAVLRCGPANA